MIFKEECSQLELLKNFRENASHEVIELNQWLSTRDGSLGWQERLYVFDQFYVHNLSSHL